MSGFLRHAVLITLLALGSAASSHASPTIKVDGIEIARGEAESFKVWSTRGFAQPRGTLLTTGQVSLADLADLRTRRIRDNLPADDAFASLLARTGFAASVIPRRPIHLFPFGYVVVDERPRHRFGESNGELLQPSPGGRLSLLPPHGRPDLYADWPLSDPIPPVGGRIVLRNHVDALVGGRIELADSGLATPQTVSLQLAGETGLRAGFVSAVPEPEVYAMLAAGLGLIGWKLRRRQHRGEADAVGR